MRLLRGRESDVAADREATAAMLAAAGDGESAVRVWAPHRQVAFGRRDASEPGYETAVDRARRRGFEPVERSVGGRAVAYGGSTLAFAYAVPIGDVRTGMDDRYGAAMTTVLSALRAVGADVERAEPPAAFCPGDHSIRGAGASGAAAGKVCGIAQRVQSDAALVSGCVLVRDHGALAAVLAAVYDALDVRFDPETVGSVAAAGGAADPARVARALEDAVVGDRERRVERLPEASPADPEP